jgi:uncharacterized membrane protein YjfL (UPF0719 family)
MTRSLRILSIIALAAGAAMASDPAPATTAGSPWGGVVGSVGGLIIGVIQVILGLTMAAFAVTTGLKILGKLIEGIDIWTEIKNKNIAVALLAAAVVLSYTNVIGSGIENMTSAVAALASTSASSWWGGVVGLISGFINLLVAIALASVAITVTFKIMDKLTTDIDEKTEFKNGNVAIGVVYAGILIGVSGLVASGVSGIGKGLGSFLNALLTAVFH